MKCFTSHTPPPNPPPPPRTHTVVYSTDRSKAVVPVLVLLFVALWFILRDDSFYVLPCVIVVLCFTVLFALRLPRLGKRELILVHFVCLFGLRFITKTRLFKYIEKFTTKKCFRDVVWFCLFSLPLGVWKGLRFVIVALPGLLSYFFLLLIGLKL